MKERLSKKDCERKIDKERTIVKERKIAKKDCERKIIKEKKKNKY